MSLHSIDGTLDCDIGRRALVQCTDIIVESCISPIAPLKKLYTKEVILRIFTKKVMTRKKNRLFQVIFF